MQSTDLTCIASLHNLCYDYLQSDAVNCIALLKNAAIGATFCGSGVN